MKTVMTLKWFWVAALAMVLSLGTPALWAEGETAAEATPVAVNINAASEQELTQLDGIGLAKAQAIITYREQHGSFKTVEELAAVKGIGEATLAKNRERIRLE